MKYFLKHKNEAQYQEVDKEAYVNAERVDGFYNTLGYPDEPATSAFGGMMFDGYTEFESLADFNVPRNEKAMGYALHDASRGETTEMLLHEEDRTHSEPN